MNRRKYNNLRVEDLDTGEIYIDGETIYAEFKTEKQMRAFKENREKIEEATLRKMKEEEENLNKIPMEVFFMGNVKEMKETMKDLSITEKGLLYAIEPYVGFKDCCIEFGNGKYINAKQIAEIAGINEKTAQLLIKSLIQKNILYKDKKRKKCTIFC